MMNSENFEEIVDVIMHRVNIQVDRYVHPNRWKIIRERKKNVFLQKQRNHSREWDRIHWNEEDLMS